MKKIFFFAVISAFAVIIFVYPHQAMALDCTSGKKVQFYVVTRDTDGVLAPNINFVIYQQNTNPDGLPYLGGALATSKTDEGGQAVLCANKSDTGLYAVKFYEYSSNYGYKIVWNESITHQDSVNYSLEVRLNYMRVIIRDAEGELLKDRLFDIYVQEYDVDGHPIIGENRLNQEKLVSDKYNTGVTGAIRAYLNPGVYVLRIHGTGNTYFYLWEQKVQEGVAKSIEYRLGTLRVVFEDALAYLLKDRNFSAYLQAYDAHNQPIIGTSLGTSFSTGSSGRTDLYLPTGTYALRIPGSQADSYFSKWKVLSKNETLTRLTYRLATLRVIIKSNSGELLTNQNYSIGEQGTDAVGNPAVKKVLKTSNTGVLGYDDLYLAPRKYVFIYGTNKVYNIELFENQITIIDWPRAFSLRPNPGGIMLLNPFANNTLTIRNVASPRVTGIPNIKQNFGNAYQVLAAKINKAYTVALFYTKKGLPARGINASKLRLAFYNSITKQWRLVGTNTVAQERVVAVLNAPGTLTLVELR